ncbi:MAG TPA: N-formylglutamate amidohydrolase [Cyclobacteriaceae bacterium]|nr:N-formylglutamate amidohydrolase [Cyclobacteriaceae bacterium]
MTAPYSINYPNSTEVPILLSVPHCGTNFPPDLIPQFDAAKLQQLDDTDFFVDKLYDFAPAMGITMIASIYHRWVIDLNRDPDSKPLYTDGRVITALCPTTDFNGEHLYQNKRSFVAANEVEERKEKYFRPYHQKIEELLTDLKEKHGRVLLWDCHSIRQFVPGIHPSAFPDLILGDADEQSASAAIIKKAQAELKNSDYSFSHNFPFKGGFITRNYGKPQNNIHALQLEMSKVLYMDDAEINYDAARANKVRTLLQKILSSLIEIL